MTDALRRWFDYKGHVFERPADAPLTAWNWYDQRTHTLWPDGLGSLTQALAGTSTDFHAEVLREEIQEAFRRASDAMRPVMQQFGAAASALIDALAAARLIEPEPPADPRERALQARRNRNTGPPPDRLDGRRRRR